MYSPQGLLLRYARGRVRMFAQRQVFAFAVAVILAAVASPLAGAVSFCLHLLGDSIDSLYLRKVVPARLKAGADAGSVKRASTVTASLHALAAAAAASVAEWLDLVLKTPAQPDHGDPLLSLSLLTALALNAGLVLPYHRPAAAARLTVYALFPFGLFAVHHMQAGSTGGGELHLAGLAALYVAVAWALHFAVRNFNATRGHLLAQALQQQALEAANARLDEQRKEAERLAFVAEHANDIIRLLDREGRTLWANATFTRVTGYTLEEAKGKLLGDLIYHPDTSTKDLEEIREGRAAGRPLRVEILNRGKLGQDFWLETNQVPMLNQDGEAEAYIAVERDITANKRNEQELQEARRAAEEGARTKAEFLANMSHEIRTPLNGVVGMAQLLQSTPLNADQELYTTTILNSAQTLLVLINDVLDLSKLEAGEMLLSNADFDVRGCFEETLTLMQPQAAQKGLQLKLTYAGGLPARLHGDDRKLRQILINLTGNAIKFTETGEVRVSVKAEKDSGGGIALSFEVSDTGIGIPKEMQDRVFERFAQADATISRRFGGTGLGLTISQRLAKSMGGGIQVASEEGQGATFTARLPMRPTQDEPQPDAGAQAAPGSRGALNGLRVLVAEDNQVNRLLLRKFLADSGVDLAFATNGREAVEQAGSFAPDVIFMDMSMPVMDGLEATRLVRGRPGRQPAIIALTANAFETDRQACLDAGMDDFMSKPVSKRELLAALHRCRRPADTAATG